MNQELRLLEEILKRNSDDPDSIDITDEVDQYFFFDSIKNNEDLEAAWRVFDEHEAIRDRLAYIESTASVISGWGYRIPGSDHTRCDDEELKNLVDAHIANVRPMLLDEGYNTDVIRFIDGGYRLEIAPADMVPPDVSDNELFGVIYEAISEYLIENFPCNKDHYEVLNNWAVYLTKCDEVATYLLWPCLNNEANLASNTMDSGAKLWKLGCRDRFWIKDSDYTSKTVYIKPSWPSE